MNSSFTLNRRQWLRSTGAAMAGLALASRAKLTAQTSAGAAPVPAAALDLPVQLSLNENPFGPSPLAVAAMQAEMARPFRYPFNQTPELIKVIAAKEDVAPEQIVMGVGSGEVLETYGVYMAREKGEVIAAQPGYLQLAGAMQRMGATLVQVPLNDRLEHDLEAMAAKITPATKCVYLCNPNNPTGTVVAPEKLRGFAIEVAKRVPVFIDEAYLECSDNFSANTMVGLVRDGHNVTIARTFSKIHGLAGLRIGYGVMPAELAKAVRGFTTGGMNLMGVAAARANLTDAGYVERTRVKIKAGRDSVIAVLKEKGRRYAEPQGNFVFFHTGVPIAEFREKMRAEGVLVARPFPPLLDWCRISIGSPEEMTVANAALRKVLS